jgi:MFS transporter, DHA1 family, inner membrane transport protein
VRLGAGVTVCLLAAVVGCGGDADQTQPSPERDRELLAASYANRVEEARRASRTSSLFSRRQAQPARQTVLRLCLSRAVYWSLCFLPCCASEMTPPAARASSARVTVAVALAGLCGAWNAGNVGPVASEVSHEFGVSLAMVGVLAGTLFLGAVAIGLLGAAQLGERIGAVHGLRLACGLLVVANVLFAISPIFAGLVIGRVVAGLAFALTNTLGVVWARDEGGVRLLGVFGGSIQLGIAGALLTGSALADLGVDWRVGFAISAVLAAAAFFSIPAGSRSTSAPARHSTGFLIAAIRHVRVYRLALLFVSIFGVPLILGTWLIEYLSRDGGIATSLAGVIAFLLFGLSAAMRVLGARLQGRGVSHRLLGGSLGLAAVGLAAITFDPAAAVAFAAVVLLALGFGIPYATALSEAEDLYPDAPGEPVALMTLVSLIPPIVAIPLIGDALSHGGGQRAFGMMAAFLVLAALANLRRTGIPLPSARAGAGAQARG